MTAAQIRETAMRGKALLALSDGRLLCGHAGRLRFYDTASERLLSETVLPLPGWKRLAVRFRLAERALHAECRWAHELPDGNILFSFENGIFSMNPAEGVVRRETVPVRGKPLMIAPIRDIPGFADGVAFGDYGGNDRRDPVRIFFRPERGAVWETAYTFPAGEIRHVHGLFPCAGRECVYILTGDEDGECGIWEARDGFRSVCPVLRGNQQYRACQMQALPDGDILFMTDSPSEPNHMFRLSSEGDVSPCGELPGTCIYGRPAFDGGIYSTTCEPDAKAPNRAVFFLTNRPGKGIRSRTIEVFTVNDRGEKNVLAAFQHDGLPLRLFQYAAVTFAEGDKIYFTPQCVRKHDSHVFLWQDGFGAQG